MKRTLSIFVSMLLLVSFALAEAPPVPTPIIGEFLINGHKVSGYIVEVENLATGEVLSGLDIASLNTERGKFAMDLGQLEQGYFEARYRRGTLVSPGDVIEFRIRGIPESVYQINVPEQTPFYFTKEVITSDTSVYYVCADKTIVSSSQLCPKEVPKPIPVPTPLPDPEKEVDVPVLPPDSVEDEDDISTIQTLLLSMIAAILAVFVWGKGFAGLIKWRLRMAKQALSRGDKAEAKKHKNAAEKMAKTAITNFMAGKYKK